MTTEERKDLDISGSGRVSGGAYADVDISGAGTVSGDLYCESLDCSGSGHIDGNLECEGDMDCSGSFHCSGNIQTDGIDASGSFHCDGDLKAGEVDASGSFKIGGTLSAEELDVDGSVCAKDIHAGRVEVDGSLKVEGGVEAEHFSLEGAATIPGLLNAEEISITANPSVKIGDIGGSKITITDGLGGNNGIVINLGGSRTINIQPGIFSMQRKKAVGNMTVNTIEGDEISLESVTADVVRGRVVTIGEHCKIRRVEYSESLRNEPDTVDEAVKTE